jgi:hypothetical protein
MQFGRAIQRQPRLFELGAGLPDVRRVLDRRQQLAGSGDAVSGEGAIERGALFRGAIPQLLGIELDERLTGAYGVAEVGEHPDHPAVHLRGDCDLVRRRERAGDLDLTPDILALDHFHVDDGLGCRRGTLGTRRLRTSGCERCGEGRSNEYGLAALALASLRHTTGVCIAKRPSPQRSMSRPTRP